MPQVHDHDYVERFCSGTLDEAAVKRIRFGEVVRSPALIKRTLAELAGVHKSHAHVLIQHLLLRYL